MYSDILITMNIFLIFIIMYKIKINPYVLKFLQTWLLVIEDGSWNSEANNVHIFIFYGNIHFEIVKKL